MEISAKKPSLKAEFLHKAIAAEQTLRPPRGDFLKTFIIWR